MKFTTLPAEKLTLEKLFIEMRRNQAVFLTLDHEVNFVLMPADDADQEVCALQNNQEFMAYLQETLQRAKTEHRYGLEEIKAEFGIKQGKRRPSKPPGPGASRSQKKIA